MYYCLGWYLRYPWYQALQYTQYRLVECSMTRDSLNPMVNILTLRGRWVFLAHRASLVITTLALSTVEDFFSLLEILCRYIYPRPKQIDPISHNIHLRNRSWRWPSIHQRCYLAISTSIDLESTRTWQFVVVGRNGEYIGSFYAGAQRSLQLLVVEHSRYSTHLQSNNSSDKIRRHLPI